MNEEGASPGSLCVSYMCSCLPRHMALLSAYPQIPPLSLRPFGSQLTPMIVLLGRSHLVGFQGAGPTHLRSWATHPVLMRADPTPNVGYWPGEQVGEEWRLFVGLRCWAA